MISCRNGHVRKVFAALYRDSGLVGNKRDIYEEYLAMPHHCPSTMAVTPNPVREWRLYTIKELLVALKKKVEETSVVFKSGDCLPSYKEKLRTTQNTQVSWSYGIIGCSQFNPPVVSKSDTLHTWLSAWNHRLSIVCMYTCMYACQSWNVNLHI